MPRILQITDPHILPPGHLAYGVIDTAGALRRVVAEVNAALTRIGPVDLAVITGDLTDHGTAEEYAAFKHIMADLQIDIAAIPGNHDHREAMRSAFAGHPWMPAKGPIHWRLDLGGPTVIGLDTHVPGASHGRIGAAQLDWLADQLAGLADRPLIVAMHHPPVATGITQMDRQGLEDPDALAALLARHAGPCRIIAGHVHRLVMDMLGPVPVIIGPGTSHAVTLDLREARAGTYDMEPGGVLVHDIGTGIRSHLLPVGGFGGPFPFAGPESPS